jgi:23S rRNA (pseudouridine1915-N3)-methyltransferase
MKIQLARLQNKGCDWADRAASEYSQKISAMVAFEEIAIKSKSADRESADAKRAAEAEAILKTIDSSDDLILFDEKGRSFKSSRDFSEQFLKIMGRGKKRAVFLIGGPYGFDPSLQKRANDRISFSGLTFNHHLARVVALEQIYRALAIWKNLPYHND